MQKRSSDYLMRLAFPGTFRAINMPGVGLADKVIPAAHFLPPGEAELACAGLEEKPSKVVKAPGIKGCYIWMEYRPAKFYEGPRGKGQLAKMYV